MPRPSVILVELSELAPMLMERFLSAGELPNFARLRRESELYITETDVLEPRAAWATLHTGTNAPDESTPRIWDTLSDKGLSSWICGSIDAIHQRGLRGVVLPTPSDLSSRSTMPELDRYLEFVRANIEPDRAPLGPFDYAKFALFMVQHGLSPESVVGLGLQIAEERRSGDGRWKRAVSIDLLQFDLFRHYFKMLRPDFATFFSGATAQYQRDALPTDALLYGFRRMDSLVGRLVELAGDDTTLVFATALGNRTPDGMLWVRRLDRRHVTHEERLPLAQVAPLLTGLLAT